MTFVREAGPLRLAFAGRACTLEELAAIGTFGATNLRAGEATLRTVEHLLAALAGLGVRSDLRIVVTGEELPLLDGGALSFARAIEALGIAPRPPPLVVARAATFDVEGSRYAFSPAAAAEVEVEVEVELPPSCAPRASWRGGAADFVARIAPARTFALEADVEEMTRRGLARHVDPTSVVVVGRDALHGAGATPADEPARHKLLDLVGDAFAHGGPPVGALHVLRPGHARNHAAFFRALTEGILVRREPPC